MAAFGLVWPYLRFLDRGIVDAYGRVLYLDSLIGEMPHYPV